MIRRFFWLFYDHLGSVIALNLLWSALNIPYALIAYTIAKISLPMGPWVALGGMVIAVQVALFSPPSLVLYWAGASWVRRREISLREMWSRLKGQYGRAQLLQLILLFASSALLLNAAFYRDFSGLFGLFLSALMAWVLIALLLVSLYVVPVLVTQDTNVGNTLRQSALLAVTHLGHSLLQGIVFCLFLAVGALSGIGLFCGVFAAWGLWFSVYLRGVLIEYTGERWEDEEHRSLRDIIRPWES